MIQEILHDTQRSLIVLSTTSFLKELSTLYCPGCIDTLIELSLIFYPILLNSFSKISHHSKLFIGLDPKGIISELILNSLILFLIL